MCVFIHVTTMKKNYDFERGQVDPRGLDGKNGMRK